jgi:hypothetical protein
MSVRVVMREGSRETWWVLEDAEAAARFARFVTEEIDPAEVVPAEAQIPLDAAVHDPVHELLSWRDMILAAGKQVPR